MYILARRMQIFPEYTLNKFFLNFANKVIYYWLFCVQELGFLKFAYSGVYYWMFQIFLDSVWGGDLPNFLQQEERRKKTKLILRVLPTKPNYIIIYYSIIYYLGNIKSKETSEKVSLHENILTPIFCISILPLITR